MFHLIIKPQMNTALNTTHSSVHPEFVLREDHIRQMPTTSSNKLLEVAKILQRFIYIKELHWSEVIESSTAHHVLLFHTKSTVSNRAVPVDLGRGTVCLI